MPKSVNWDKIIDSIQTIMMWFLIIVIALCVLALILFDILVGTGVMLYLTGDDWKASLFISMATSGLLISLMMTGYTIMSKRKQAKAALGVGGLVLLIAFGVYGLDVYFDSLTADYLRFDKVIAIVDLSPDEQGLHRLFRILLGGISTIGEGLAIAIIIGLPVLKEVIRNTMPRPSYPKVTSNYKKTTSHKTKPTYTHKIPDIRKQFPNVK